MKYISTAVVSWFLSIFLLTGLSVHSSLIFAGTKEDNQIIKILLDNQRNFLKDSAERLVFGRNSMATFTKEGHENKLVDFKELISSYASEHEKCEGVIGHFSADQKKFGYNDLKKISSCNRGEMDKLWYKISNILKTIYPNNQLDTFCSKEVYEYGKVEYYCRKSYWNVFE